MTSKYADQRLSALWDRVEQLEAAVDVAGAFLEEGGNSDRFRITAPLALAALKAVLQKTFKGALLCNRETSDESLDIWLSEIESHEAHSEAAP